MSSQLSGSSHQHIWPAEIPADTSCLGHLLYGDEPQHFPFLTLGRDQRSPRLMCQSDAHAALTRTRYSSPPHSQPQPPLRCEMSTGTSALSFPRLRSPSEVMPAHLPAPHRHCAGQLTTVTAVLCFLYQNILPSRPAGCTTLGPSGRVCAQYPGKPEESRSAWLHD